MYVPWDGCVWIHSNRVLTYHLLHWQRAMMDNPIIFYYTVAPPPSSPEIHITNVKYQIFYHEGLQIKHLTNKYCDTIELLNGMQNPSLLSFCFKATIWLIRKALFMLFIVVLNKKQSTPRSWGRQKARSSGSWNTIISLGVLSSIISIIHNHISYQY